LKKKIKINRKCVLYNRVFVCYIISVFLLQPHFANLATGSSHLKESHNSIFYDEVTRTIYVFGGSVETLVSVRNYIGDETILNETQPKRWFLNANLYINDTKTTFLITNADCDWLKINSTAESIFHIVIKGTLIINNTRITSWNTTSDAEAALRPPYTMARAYIKVELGGGGRTHILNSNLSYLGYYAQQSYGISYYSGNGSIIDNNILSYNYMGFYSDGVSNITIKNNRVFNNYAYGLDPHTGSRGFKVQNNTIYQNGNHGLIFSEWCENNTLANNTIYNNNGHGIMLHKLSNHNTIRGNIVSNNAEAGISIFNSSLNLVENNSIYNNKYGIRLNYGSQENTIKNNVVENSSLYGIYVYEICERNIFVKNTVFGSTTNGIYVDKSHSNLFVQNNVKGSYGHGIQLLNCTNNTFTNNIVVDNALSDYYSKGKSSNLVINTVFKSTVFKFYDKESNITVMNTDNSIVKSIPNRCFPANNTLFIISDKDRYMVTLDTVPVFVRALTGSVCVEILNYTINFLATLRLTQTGKNTVEIKMHWENVNENVKIKFLNGTILNGRDYWDYRTRLITISFSFNTSTVVNVYTQTSEGQRPFGWNNHIVAPLVIGIVIITIFIWKYIRGKVHAKRHNKMIPKVDKGC